jgi:4-diphosphocytidyl-2-C-methyl-D-erythritol kinase
MPKVSRVVVKAPAKVNISLQVGPLQADGFHPVETIYQAVDLYDDVIAEVGAGLSLTIEGVNADAVGAPEKNLAWRAATLLAESAGIKPNVHLHIVKRIPVAGGMAGGSADAAGALVACDAVWGLQTPRERLVELAAELGSDIPFSIVGGTALGRGRGEDLTTVLTRGEFHWVFATSELGLSTPDVYKTFDELNPNAAAPKIDDALLSGLATGDASVVGKLLNNNLQDAAIRMRGSLRRILDAGIGAGAIGAVVSGSGPTCAFLAKSAEHATSLAIELSATGLVSRTLQASGPTRGATVVSIA